MNKADLTIAGLLTAIAAVAAVEITNIAKRAEVTRATAPVEQAATAVVPAPQPPAPTSSYDTDKAAVGYWKAACDIKHGHIARSAGGDQVIAYWKELGIDPDQAYGDANATTRAEMLDKKAGTNCFA